MTLGELIAYLEKLDPAMVVSQGFGRPHSYRGDYAQLAFQPAQNVTIGAMLEAARQALGETYHGYKGGEYRMSQYTDVYLAKWGETGDALGFLALDGMLVLTRLAAAEARAERAEAALRTLVRLKDGPRDAEYERQKPLAWAAARAAVDDTPEE